MVAKAEIRHPIKVSSLFPFAQALSVLVDPLKELINPKYALRELVKLRLKDQTPGSPILLAYYSQKHLDSEHRIVPNPTGANIPIYLEPTTVIAEATKNGSLTVSMRKTDLPAKTWPMMLTTVANFNPDGSTMLTLAQTCAPNADITKTVGQVTWETDWPNIPISSREQKRIYHQMTRIISKYPVYP